MTTKKTKPKPRPVSSANGVAKLKKTIAGQAREIREAAAEQAATGEILRMIARAPDDLQSVLDAIAESAAKLCDADDVLCGASTVMSCEERLTLGQSQ